MPKEKTYQEMRKEFQDKFFKELSPALEKFDAERKGKLRLAVAGAVICFVIGILLIISPFFITMSEETSENTFKSGIGMFFMAGFVWAIIKKNFENKIKNGELFEHEEIHNNFYGVLNSSLKEVEKRENHYIKDIGVLGQINLKRALKDKAEVLSIFLTAPKDELIRRLKARGDHDIDLRISRMEFELSYSKNYDYVIENLNLNKTLKKIESIIKKHEKIEQKRFKKQTTV